METPMTFWDRVKLVASDLGVKKRTIVKWQQRGGVSAKWRIPIHQHSQILGHPIELNELTETKGNA